MGTLRVLNQSGDAVHSWNPKNAKSVVKAEAIFNKLCGEGYLAFSVDGDTSTHVRDFDPTAEEVIMSPRIVAG